MQARLARLGEPEEEKFRQKGVSKKQGRPSPIYAIVDLPKSHSNLGAFRLAGESEQADLVVAARGGDGGSREPALNLLAGETGREVDAAVEDLDRDLTGVAVENSRNLDRLAGGTVKVVGRATRDVGVEGGLALGVASSENLEDVKLTARGPARARVVLGGAGNLGVQEPEGRHVSVETGGTVHGHVELEEPDRVLALEAVVGNRARAVVPAAAVGALLVAVDGELLVGGEVYGVQDLRRSSATAGIRVEVRQRVTEDVVELARALTTVVAEEDEAVSDTLVGVVVGNTAVFAAGASSGGAGLARAGLAGAGGLGGGGGSNNRRLRDSSRSRGGRHDGSNSRSVSHRGNVRSGGWVPVVDPRLDNAVDGSSDPDIALLLLVVMSLSMLLVQVVVTVAAGVSMRHGGRTLGAGLEVVHSNLLEVHGTTEERGELRRC